jgi:hypothetical protein
MKEKPNPWDVLNDFLKTIITVATGFLAFTITFSEKLIQSFADNGLPGLLIACWIVLVISIGAALFAVGRLVAFLKGNSSGEWFLIFISNISYFALFAAALLLFLLTFRAKSVNDNNFDSQHAKEIALQYIRRVDTSATANLVLRDLRLNSRSTEWELTYSMMQDTVIICLEPKTMKVTSFHRR